jgi:hypothetical protein
MDPMPISAYKMGRILRKDEQWVASLQMTPEEKAHLQELLKGTPNQYGAPSATKIYEFEESIYERKIQKDKETMDELIRQNEQLKCDCDLLSIRVEQNANHIEHLTRNASQLTNQVEQLIGMVTSFMNK